MNLHPHVLVYITCTFSLCALLHTDQAEGERVSHWIKGRGLALVWRLQNLFIVHICIQQTSLCTGMQAMQVDAVASNLLNLPVLYKVS